MPDLKQISVERQLSHMHTLSQGVVCFHMEAVIKSNDLLSDMCTSD